MDQRSVNFLDPGPCCSDWDIHVWKEGEGPEPDPFPNRFHLGIIGRDPASMEMAGLSTFGMFCCRVRSEHITYMKLIVFEHSG